MDVEYFLNHTFVRMVFVQRMLRNVNYVKNHLVNALKEQSDVKMVFAEKKLTALIIMVVQKTNLLPVLMVFVQEILQNVLVNLLVHQIDPSVVLTTYVWLIPMLVKHRLDYTTPKTLF